MYPALHYYLMLYDLFIVADKIGLKFQRRKDCITFSPLSKDLFFYNSIGTKLTIRLFIYNPSIYFYLQLVMRI